MNDLIRYRAMESLCRQCAVFHPHDSWQLLAEAEMWHHKAEDAIASLTIGNDSGPPTRTAALVGSLGRAENARRSLAS